MQQGAAITVRGAREHNLCAVDLDLPRGELIVFAGVSGSGKSSLAFDTLHAEGRRRYLEALSVHARDLRRPDVDAVVGLPPTVAVDQRISTPPSRSTVGSYSEVEPMLRVLFARDGTQHCPGCGRAIEPVSHDHIVADLMAVPAGGRLLLTAPLAGPHLLPEVAQAGFSRVRVDGEVRRLDSLAPGEADDAEVSVVVDRIKLGPDKRERLHDAVRTTARAGAGVVVAVLGDEERIYVDRPYCHSCARSFPELRPGLLSRWGEGACPRCGGPGCDDCGGTGLCEDSRHVVWHDVRFPELVALPSVDLAARQWPRTAVTELAVDELTRRLSSLVELGLGSLPLSRISNQLSSGEWQRLRLARQLAAELSGVLYVLDEPTALLDDVLVARVVGVLRRLVEQGNTVLVVEHNPRVIEAADRVVEFGPGPGARGGRVVYEGPPAALLEADTPTGRWLSGRERLDPERSELDTLLRIVGTRHGDLTLPIGRLAAIVGPSGSGKSTLLEVVRAHLASHLGLTKDTPPAAQGISGLDGVERLVVVDRAGVVRSARSNPATYTGLWDTVRELLASTREGQIRGFSPGTFSLNIKGGRCESCAGTGSRRIDLEWLPDVQVPCEVCHGNRFTSDVCEVRWKGAGPHELLAMAVDEAHPLLAGHPRLDAALRALQDVGLGYVPLGQPASSLSGGEAQRLKLARELTRIRRSGGAGTVFLVDNPGVGLHPHDLSVLHGLFRSLVREGASVWMSTHHALLANAADYVITLREGEIVAELDSSSVGENAGD